ITAPAAPGQLVATPQDGQVSLAWGASASADTAGYRVYVSSDPDVLSATPVSVTGTSTVVTGLANGVTYYVAVRAVDRAGNESAPTATATVTPIDTTAAAAPTGLVAVPGDGHVLLSWDPVAAADLAGYRVYYSTTPGEWVRAPGTPTETTYDLVGLTNGTTYAVAVTAVDLAGNESVRSAPASATPAATP
ncbi:MAG TPA: fibronectin type III domain-containing protein, partial [Actinoplanes sp.]